MQYTSTKRLQYEYNTDAFNPITIRTQYEDITPTMPINYENNTTALWKQHEYNHAKTYEPNTHTTRMQHGNTTGTTLEQYFYNPDAI